MGAASTSNDVISSSLLENAMITNAILHVDDGPQIIKYYTNCCNCNDEESRFDDGQLVRACGPTALNCVRLAYRIWNEGARELDFLKRLTADAVVKDMRRISIKSSVTAPPAVQDILKAPIFKDSVACLDDTVISSYGDLKIHFSSWSDFSATEVAAVVFRQQQEIVACLRVPYAGSSIYALFDPHPRPTHYNGPAFTLSRHLDQLSMFSNPHGISMSAQEIHAYVLDTVRSPTNEDKHTLASSDSCEPLSINDQKAPRNKQSRDSWLRDLQSQPSPHFSEVQRGKQRDDEGDEDGPYETWITGSQSDAWTTLSIAPADAPYNSTTDLEAGSSTSPKRLSHQRLSMGSTLKARSSECLHSREATLIDHDWDLALQLQEEEEMATTLGRMPETAWLVALQKRLREQQKLNEGSSSSTSSALSEWDWQLAVTLQQEEEAEGPGSRYRRPPDVESHILSSATQRNAVISTFDCGICGETVGNDLKKGPTECGHGFCQDCLTNYVKNKIESGRYPIFCPICSIERSRTDKSQLSQELLEGLSFTAQEKTRLTELQLVGHSVSLQCPRCNESMYVDRTEYAENKVLVCPLPRCGHKWCKSCLKGLASSQENHRCKNDNIDRLMRRRGWKYCPGCRVPVQKESGCNHMTCGSPGCNVHFCYKCGVLIVDTTNGGDVGLTVTEHFNNCRLFEKKLKCCIQ